MYINEIFTNQIDQNLNCVIVKNSEGIIDFRSFTLV